MSFRLSERENTSESGVMELCMNYMKVISFTFVRKLHVSVYI